MTEIPTNDEYYIKSLLVKNVMDIQNFDIPIDENERKHLIITGKNGSGKTTLLMALNNLLMKFVQNQFQNLKQYNTQIKQQITHIDRFKKQTDSYIKAISDAESKIKSFERSLAPTKFQRIKENEQSIESYKTAIDTANQNIIRSEQTIETNQNAIENFSNIDANFTNQDELHKHVFSGSFIMAFFDAKRIINKNAPTAIQKIQLPLKTVTVANLHQSFLQYIVNLRMEMLDAREENEQEEVNKIETWFITFEDALKELFVQDDLKLKYYRKEFNYHIEYENKSFPLNQLSDGYSAVLSIITDLILRMEAHKVNSYDLQGVVLIDEIETHLHVELQKKILPFLTKFFPKLQFIVSTHSPFVLSSLKNAVICDLEHRSITEDLYGYSYEALIESHFLTDKYSDKIKKDIERYSELFDKYKTMELTDAEALEYVKLDNYFDKLPRMNNEEIGYEINQIKASE